MAWALTMCGLGFDNVMHFYKKQNTTDELELIQAFQQHTGLISGNVLPYVFRGSDTLRNIFKENYTHGITIGCPGFFGPQGRILRLELAYPGLIDKLTSFKYQQKLTSFKYQQDFISNFEMESSAIYGLCRSMGHQCVSLNVIVANRVAQKFSSDSNKAVEALIKHSIELLADNL